MFNVNEANDIITKYLNSEEHTDDERADFAEAMNVMYEETGDSNFLVSLASMYFEQEMYELAIGYYEIAAGKENLYALTNLGYIWYYGKSGEVDYAKAFSCFDKAWEMGDLASGIKVAEMYKKGQFVKQDDASYKRVLEYMAKQVEESDDLTTPLPEIYDRLACVYAEEGDDQKALSLFDQARDFLSKRIAREPYSADLVLMKELIGNIYSLRPFDYGKMSLYDLYHLLAKPGKVRFSYQGTDHKAEALQNGEMLSIRFDSLLYASIDDFFELATIDGALLSSIYLELENFEFL